jgi:hypothetical protein
LSRKIIILIVSLNFTVQLFGQVERQALQSIEQGKWSKARTQLAKASRKDTLSIASSFAWAAYFSSAANPDFSLDSANYHARRAFLSFQRTTIKQRERLKRLPIDSIVLLTLSRQIDSLAFHHALLSSTTTEYQNFIDRFPHAKQLSAAIALRDSVAFKVAIVRDSQQAFRQFIESYPQAVQMPEAIHKYDKLLFDSLTSDKKIFSYQNYLQEYPNSAFAREAARNIFEIQTASGTTEAYRQSILQGHKYYTARAKNILFYLLRPHQLSTQLPRISSDDSLKIAIGLVGSYVSPVLHNGKFGFIDPDGKEVIAAEYEEIPDEYVCGHIVDDIIVLPDKVVARSGTVIINHPVRTIDDIGSGFLLMSTDTCTTLIHKTAFRVGPQCIDRARILNGRFLAVQLAGKWGVYTLSGRMLLSFQWDDISTTGNVIVLTGNERISLVTEAQLASFAESPSKASMLIEVDEMTKWDGDRFLVRQGDMRRVLTLALDTLWSGEQRNIRPAPLGIIVVDSSGTRIINNRGERSPAFQDIKWHGRWTSVQTQDGWSLFDPLTNTKSGFDYDTIMFMGPFAIGERTDSIHIRFLRDATLSLKQPANTVVTGMDSTFFLTGGSGVGKHLYDQHGRRLFPAPYDRVQYIGNGYFTVYRRDKIGLINIAGRVVVPVEMDAIGSVRDGTVSLLRDAKFGSFNCTTGKLIAPQYTNNLVAYNDNLVIGLSDGLYRILNWENKEIMKSGFAEIRYWNDTAAFVRKDFQWMICEIKSGRVLMDGIRHIKVVREVAADKLVIVNAGHNFGVLHNQKGIIIPLSFTDIINVGSPRQPLYFAEKRVEEADLFVVLYYDAAGQVVRKEVYAHDDYERIYCPNN